MIVRIEHARKIAGPNSAGYCVPGMKIFFDKHGLNFRDFVKNGIEAEKLIATGDHMALMVVDIAKRENENG